MFSGVMFPSRSRGTEESWIVLKVVQGCGRRESMGHCVVSWQVSFIVIDALERCFSNLGAFSKCWFPGPRRGTLGECLGVSAV